MIFWRWFLHHFWWTFQKILLQQYPRTIGKKFPFWRRMSRVIFNMPNYLNKKQCLWKLLCSWSELLWFLATATTQKYCLATVTMQKHSSVASVAREKCQNVEDEKFLVLIFLLKLKKCCFQMLISQSNLNEIRLFFKLFLSKRTSRWRSYFYENNSWNMKKIWWKTPNYLSQYSVLKLKR